MDSGFLMPKHFDEILMGFTSNGTPNARGVGKINILEQLITMTR